MALVAVVNRALGWELTPDDLAPYGAELAIVLAVFHRGSLAVAARWPRLGYVLFGSGRPPSYPPPEISSALAQRLHPTWHTDRHETPIRNGARGA